MVYELLLLLPAEARMDAHDKSREVSFVAWATWLQRKYGRATVPIYSTTMMDRGMEDTRARQYRVLFKSCPSCGVEHLRKDCPYRGV
ncbi:hypothetical protein GNI_016300 [Gregarina niphandrodes]|uniref:Uncharacterized protein n=1 Tax=Gregarina niphandrodes TaxID=110365 RepID=A0A023BCJ8_GRENI|nr:hypothetical protein GNI_016300 [Gregarina niphandrodes]EZG82589.1 hypothetical protein GNI_016300 [Gregarina niphandrodes]|eukprot:XP_011128983.1 hypothetical protein GNI_016300 [Gregarina niphandrodes]